MLIYRDQYLQYYYPRVLQLLLSESNLVRMIKVIHSCPNVHLIEATFFYFGATRWPFHKNTSIPMVHMLLRTDDDVVVSIGLFCFYLMSFSYSGLQLPGLHASLTHTFNSPMFKAPATGGSTHSHQCHYCDTMTKIVICQITMYT